MGKSTPNVRYSEIDRDSQRSRVHLVLGLDGGTRCDAATGFAQFDGLLRDLARYAAFDLGVTVESDGPIDASHLAEDVGAAMGKALRGAVELSDEVVGIAHAVVPNGDALVLAAVDLRSRPYLAFEAPFSRESVADLATEAIQEFFQAMSLYSGSSIHVRALSGKNDAHLAEACFRAAGRALAGSTRLSGRANGC
jgi:imidazoleglycerol-phosphate dehydratase